jgi:anti-anti-sigma factor
MAFTVHSQSVTGMVSLVLTGELDAAASPAFRAEVEKAAAQSPKRLTLDVRDLTFMASAGLRVLIYAKQKLGPDTAVYIVAPQEAVVDTLQKTGFDRSVYIVAEAPVA